MTLRIHESKTDQEAKGTTLAIGVRETEALCALRAVEAWLTHSEGKLDESAPLFPKMNGNTVTREAMSL